MPCRLRLGKCHFGIQSVRISTFEGIIPLSLDVVGEYRNVVLYYHLAYLFWPSTSRFRCQQSHVTETAAVYANSEVFEGPAEAIPCMCQ